MCDGHDRTDASHHLRSIRKTWLIQGGGGRLVLQEAGRDADAHPARAERCLERSLLACSARAADTGDPCISLTGMLGESPGYSGPLLELWAYLLLIVASANLALRQILASAENYLVNIVNNGITRITLITSTARSQFLRSINRGWVQCLHLADWVVKKSSLLKSSVGQILKRAEKGLETWVRASLENTLVILR